MNFETWNELEIIKEKSYRQEEIAAEYQQKQSEINKIDQEMEKIWADFKEGLK